MPVLFLLFALFMVFGMIYLASDPPLTQRHSSGTMVGASYWGNYINSSTIIEPMLTLKPVKPLEDESDRAAVVPTI